MIVVKKLTKQPDGSYEATWALSQDDASHLLSYAINSLVAEGLISIQEQEISDEKQLQLDFLTDVPKEALGKA
jgi:hypothetical protein